MLYKNIYYKININQYFLFYITNTHIKYLYIQGVVLDNILIEYII